MWKKLSKQNKKKLNYIVFILFPITSISAFWIGTKTALKLLNIQISLNGMILIVVLYLIIYLQFTFVLYKKFSEKEKASTHH